MRYNLVSVGDQSNLTVLVNGDLKVANEEHPNWQAIFKAVILDKVEDEDAVERLFDVAKAVSQKFEKVSDHVSVANGRVYLDGDEVHGAIAEQIVRFLEEDVDDWQPLVKFMEKVSGNVTSHSREQLFEWLARHKFTITPEGNFVAYKGVRSDLSSIMNGPGIVNGVAVSHVTNPIGGVIEIARSKVVHDPAVGCASGLHAGTYEYARGFAQGVVLEVHVDPRDVVSVPTDCNWQKIRTCRYTVVRAVTAPITTASTVTASVSGPEGPEYDSFSPDSTAVDYVEWEDGVLFVSLANGNSYSYPDAPYSVFEDWKNADSAGAFYNREVRGQYGEEAY
jgi:hypothetical protein